MTNEKLQLSIFSFSYKEGQKTPFDQHGGGFVFDCRCLPNPGREAAYKYKSGLEADVVAYLEDKKDVQDFFALIEAMVSQAVNVYINRQFSSLRVAFGCTGGQHRSVYFAEKLARELKNKFDIDVRVEHLNRQGWLKA